MPAHLIVVEYRERMAQPVEAARFRVGQPMQVLSHRNQANPDLWIHGLLGEDKTLRGTLAQLFGSVRHRANTQ
jgi:hypothetical protein